MDEKTYNGWSNYETWCVALWLDNEQESYERWRSRAREAIERAPQCFPAMFPESTPNATATALLADKLSSETVDNVPDVFSGVYADLLSAALSEVNWYEIAGHYVNDLAGETVEKLAGGKAS